MNIKVNFIPWVNNNNYGADLEVDINGEKKVFRDDVSVAELVAFLIDPLAQSSLKPHPREVHFPQELSA